MGSCVGPIMKRYVTCLLIALSWQLGTVACAQQIKILGQYATAALDDGSSVVLDTGTGTADYHYLAGGEPQTVVFPFLGGSEGEGEGEGEGEPMVCSGGTADRGQPSTGDLMVLLGAMSVLALAATKRSTGCHSGDSREHEGSIPMSKKARYVVLGIVIGMALVATVGATWAPDKTVGQYELGFYPTSSSMFVVLDTSGGTANTHYNATAGGATTVFPFER